MKKNKGMPQRYLLASLLLMLSACTTSSRIVLLPDAEGKVGQVEVVRDGEAILLTEAYQAADSGIFGVSAKRLDASQVDARYGGVRAGLPKAPQRFVLYFEAGGQELTEESRVRIGEVRAALTAFSAPDILVTGHTDRVGSVELNDSLSLARAAAVRDMLIAEGFEADKIAVAGRGEREPAVPTEDEVSEASNRRVEVKVR